MMRHRLLKEVRCLLPAWVLALVLPLTACLAFGRLEHLFNGVLPFALVFSALVGAAAFGTEFHHGTMPLLLSQPTSRHRLWHEKMLVLGAALASVGGVYALISDMPVSLYPLFLVPALCAFGVTPYLTLMSGSAVVATGLTLAGSAVLARVGTELFQEWPRDNQISGPFYVYVLAAHAAYAACGYCLGYTKFVGWETNGRSAWRDDAAAWVQTLDKFSKTWSSRPAGPVGCLVRKEFGLQRLSLLLAGVLCVLGVGAVFLSRAHPVYGTDALKNIVFLYCLFFPILTGTVTVAEERGLGVLEWHLTLPVPVWKQWAVKLAVAWGISLLLGFFLPWGLALLNSRAGPETGAPWFHVANYLFFCLVGTSLAIYASSVSRNVLRAVTMTCGLFFPALFAGDWLQGILVRHRIDEVILGGRYHHLCHPYAIVAGGCGLIALILWLALSGFRTSEAGSRNSAILKLAAVCVTVSLLLFTRFALLTVLSAAP